MKTNLNVLLLPILAHAFIVPADAAGRETFDIATFTPPPGWERVVSPGLLSFRTPASQKEPTQIFLFPSQPSGGNPATNFEAEWARLVAGRAPVPPHTAEQRPDGWTLVTGAARLESQGVSFVVLQVTATGFDRMISMGVQMAGQSHVAEVDQFFRQLEFRVAATGNPPVAQAGAAANRPAEPAVPPRSSSNVPIPIGTARLDKGRPVGLFYRMKVQVQSGARLEAEPWLFLPGDRIARTFPYGGGEAFDPAARCLPDTCGSYQIDAGTLAVRWDNGRVDRWAFAATAEGITLDGTLFRPARPLTEAALAGEWTGAGDSGNASSNIYRFERGGSFTFGTSQKPGPAGRYRVQGMTLLLTFADGTQSRRTLFAAGTSDPAALICVEGEAYKRK